MDIYSCENSPQFIAIESGITHAALSQADCLAITGILTQIRSEEHLCFGKKIMIYWRGGTVDI